MPAPRSTPANTCRNHNLTLHVCAPVSRGNPLAGRLTSPGSPENPTYLASSSWKNCRGVIDPNRTTTRLTARGMSPKSHFYASVGIAFSASTPAPYLGVGNSLVVMPSHVTRLFFLPKLALDSGRIRGNRAVVGSGARNSRKDQ